MSTKKNYAELSSLKTLYDELQRFGFDFLQPGQPLGAFEQQQIELHVEAIKAKRGQSLGILKNWHIARFYYLRLISQYYSGEFKPETEDEELLMNLRDVWKELIDGWYFGTVYIAYGEDVLNLEKSLWEQHGDKKDFHNCKWDNPIRLFKVESNAEDGTNLYTSVFSKVKGIRLPEEELIACSCNGTYNWIVWWDLIGEYLAGLSAIPESIKTTRKTWVAFIKNKKKFDFEASQFENDNSFLYKHLRDIDGDDANIYAPANFSPSLDAPQVQLKNLEAYFEHRAAWMGFTGKGSNNKTERLVAGEIYQDMKLISNMQESNLASLQSIFKRFVLKHGLKDDLKIVLTGGTFAQGLPQSLTQSNQPINNNSDTNHQTQDD